MTTCKRFAKTKFKIFNSVFSRVMGLKSASPPPTKCMLPFFCNVITPLVMLPGMAPWANQWLNICFRIGTNMCGSLKYTSSGRQSSSGDLLRPSCFNTSRTSHSVTTPSQLAASAARSQYSGQSNHKSAPKRPQISRDSITACAHSGTWRKR